MGLPLARRTLHSSFCFHDQDGFNSAEACKHFSREVAKARFQSLETNSEDGYTTVCRNYWLAMHAKPVTDDGPAGPVLASISWLHVFVILAGGVLAVVGVNAVFSKI